MGNEPSLVQYLPLLNLISPVVAFMAIKWVIKVESRLTRIETKIFNGANNRKEG